MNKYLSLCMGVLMAWCFISCEHQELCYDHTPHAERVEYKLELSFDCEWEYNVETHVDWEQIWKPEYGISYDDIRPKEPEGVRVHIFNEDDETETVRNLTKEKSTIHFSDEGHYDLLFYNNDTEYIVFEGLESFNDAYATTRGVNRNTYRGNSLKTRGGEEVTVNPPDMLFGAYINDLYVEKSTQADTMTVTLKPLVYTYLIRYEVEEGADYISLARGALAGMARGVNLGNGRTVKEEATVMFDCNTIGDFGVQALVKSFGIPDYPNPNYSRGPQQFCLNLEAKLKNGSLQQFEFDITDQIEKQPHGGVIVVQVKSIFEGMSGGGFDIGVDGWGDAIDVPLSGNDKEK